MLGEPHAKNSGSFKQLKRPVCDLMTISVRVQLWLCDRIRLRTGNKTSCHFSWVAFIAEQSFVSAGAIVNPQANVGALLELMSMQYNFIGLQKRSTSTLSLKTSMRCVWKTKPGPMINQLQVQEESYQNYITTHSTRTSHCQFHQCRLVAPFFMNKSSVAPLFPFGLLLVLPPPWPCKTNWSVYGR